MWLHKKHLLIAFIMGILFNPAVWAQNFMSEKEMLDTFSGATVTGLLKNGNARWTQVYEEFDTGQTEGDISGDLNGRPYTSTWFIRKGKWCENWGSGNGCYDFVQVDEKTIRAYEKGTPLAHLWEIQ